MSVVIRYYKSHPCWGFSLPISSKGGIASRILLKYHMKFTPQNPSHCLYVLPRRRMSSHQTLSTWLLCRSRLVTLVPSEIDHRLGRGRISGDGRSQILGGAFPEVSRAAQAEFPRALSLFGPLSRASPMPSSSASRRRVQPPPDGLKEIFPTLIRILC